jgi:uncharacterized membrane protein
MSNRPSFFFAALRDPLLWFYCLVVGSILGILSVLRYTGYNAGILDLGSMYQAISSVLRGSPLVLTSFNGQVSRLAGHVELIYFLIAPFLAFWPDPRTLLVIQTVLMVSAAFPVYMLALQYTTSRFVARCMALVYLCYPVAQTAVLFDFHGDTLAMPLLLFALEALAQKAWRRYGLWIGLALLCKVYVALPVALLGVVMFLRGQRRAGLVTSLVAGIYGAFTFFVLRGLFAQVGSAPPVRNNYIGHYFGSWFELTASLDQRLLNGLIVIGPALFLVRRAPYWLLPALPVMGAVLLTTGPGGAFDYRYHHYALVVPFLVMAMIEGIAFVQKHKPKRNWRADMGFATAIVILFNIALVDTPFNPLFWVGLPGQGVDHAAYGNISRDRVKDQFLAQSVPPQAPLAASVFLASHLAHRETLYVTRYPDDPGGQRLPAILPEVEYVLCDSLFDYRLLLEGGLSNGADYEVKEIGFLLREPEWGLVAARDGLLLFQRNPPAEQMLAQTVSVEGSTGGPTIARFGPIGLVSAKIEAVASRRYEAEFVWTLIGEPLVDRRLVAVSQLSGTSGSRILHLPSYALMPVSSWQPGQLVREQFAFTLPADIPSGTYNLEVAWYDLASSEGHATDTRSLVTGTIPITINTLHVP